MNVSWKAVVAIAVLIGGGVALVAVHERNQKQKDTSVTVGAILPLTGDYAIIGGEIQKGIEIARAERVMQGVKSNIIYEDDQSLDAVLASNAATKLTAVDHVDVGLTAIVEEARPVAPIFARNETPLLVAWDSNAYIQDVGEYTFSNGFSTELAGERMATYAYQELGLRRIGVVAHVDAWSEVISGSFQKKFEDLGGSIVLTEQHQIPDTDYRSTIAKLKEQQVDGVYFALIPPTSVNFLNQARQLGLESVFMNGDAFLQDVIAAAGEAAEGVYFTNFYTDKAEELTVKYKQVYGTEPLDVALVSFGYDGFNTIIEAAQKENVEGIRKGLLSILGSSRTANRMEKIYRVANGETVLVEE